MHYWSLEQWASLLGAIIAALTGILNMLKITQADKNSAIRHANTIATVTGQVRPDPVTQELPKL